MADRKLDKNQHLLGDLVNKLMKAYRLDGRMKEMDVIAAWPEMMGIAVANRTKSISVRNKTLYITMDSSVMRDELSYGKSIIIERVNQQAGCELITDVWFG
jgi:predicted nucleic acid-binding Zn ribbon protein